MPSEIGLSWLAVDSEREAGAVVHEPRPAGAEALHAVVLELGLEVVERAERSVDRRAQVAVGLAAAVRAHPLPELRVVGVAAGVVADRGLLVGGQLVQVLEDLLDRLVGPFGALEQAVGAVT